MKKLPACSKKCQPLPLTLLDPLEEFLLFPKLLPEIRLLVWHWSLRIPRLVLVWKHQNRSSTSVSRSVNSPLLSVCHESRFEALRYYANPHFPLTSPYTPSSLQLKQPYYIGPGSDIVYVSGVDNPARRYKSVTWTCIFLAQAQSQSQDIEFRNITPTFAPIRKLALDEELLRQAPFWQFGRMPNAVWKMIVGDLADLEELFVVQRREDAWSVKEIEGMLVEAESGYKKYWEGMCCEGDEEVWTWRKPKVRVVSLVELVGMCWT